MQAFAVVSGIPASGKTTLAAALATKLRLPHFDKDSFLEDLFRSEGTGNCEWRRSLSMRADMLFQAAAAAEHAAVLSSWWWHPQSKVNTGTPTDWLGPASRILVEVHCVCGASVAAARFLARTRHHGHLDSRWSWGSLLAQLEQQRSLGPLFPEKAIMVDTERPIQLQPLVQAVSNALSQNRDA